MSAVQAAGQLCEADHRPTINSVVSWASATCEDETQKQQPSNASSFDPSYALTGHVQESPGKAVEITSKPPDEVEVEAPEVWEGLNPTQIEPHNDPIEPAALPAQPLSSFHALECEKELPQQIAAVVPSPSVELTSEMGEPSPNPFGESSSEVSGSPFHLTGNDTLDPAALTSQPPNPTAPSERAAEISQQSSAASPQPYSSVPSVGEESSSSAADEDSSTELKTLLPSDGNVDEPAIVIGSKTYAGGVTLSFPVLPPGKQVCFAERIASKALRYRQRGGYQVPGPKEREASRSVQFLLTNGGASTYVTKGGSGRQSCGLVGLPCAVGESDEQCARRVYSELLSPSKRLRSNIERSLARGWCQSKTYVDGADARHTSVVYLVQLSGLTASQLTLQPGVEPRLERLSSEAPKNQELPTSGWVSSSQLLQSLISRPFCQAEAAIVTQLLSTQGDDDLLPSLNEEPRWGVPTLSESARKEILLCAAVTKPKGTPLAYAPRHIEHLLSRAKERAIRHGSRCISARDVTEAAAEIRRVNRDGPRVKPVDPLPEQFELLTGKMADMKRWVDNLISRNGGRRPLVLVACEETAIMARAFRACGCDVVTCDLVASEDPTIPHFVGDFSHIQDLGFDLVISHPPCKYLSNAGVRYTNEPGRPECIRDAAALFRRASAVQAPFSAQENPCMHKEGREAIGGKRPDMVVHPWQHGHGDTKAAHFFTSGGLPPVRPTCLVQSRSHVLTQLPQTEYRGEDRGRTYIGIAAGIALSWVPTVVEYVMGYSRDLPVITPQMMVARAECSRRTSTVPPRSQAECDLLASFPARCDKIVASYGPPSDTWSSLSFVRKRGRASEPPVTVRRPCYCGNGYTYLEPLPRVVEDVREPPADDSHHQRECYLSYHRRVSSLRNLVGSIRTSLRPPVMSFPPRLTPPAAIAEIPAVNRVCAVEPPKRYRSADGKGESAKLMLCFEQQVFCWKRLDSHTPYDPLADLDLPGGSRDVSDATIAVTLVRETTEEVVLPLSVMDRVRRLLISHPKGSSGQARRDTVYVWAVELESSEVAEIRPTSGDHTSGEAEGCFAHFYPREELLTSLSQHIPGYADACLQALSSLDTATSSPPVRLLNQGDATFPECQEPSCRGEASRWWQRHREGFHWISQPAGRVRVAPVAPGPYFDEEDEEDDCFYEQEEESSSAGSGRKTPKRVPAPYKPVHCVAPSPDGDEHCGPVPAPEGESGTRWECSCTVDNNNPPVSSDAPALASPIRRLRLSKGTWLVWAPTRANFTDPMYRWTPLGEKVSELLRRRLLELRGSLSSISEGPSVPCMERHALRVQAVFRGLCTRQRARRLQRLLRMVGYLILPASRSLMDSSLPLSTKRSEAALASTRGDLNVPLVGAVQTQVRASLGKSTDSIAVINDAYRKLHPRAPVVAIQDTSCLSCGLVREGDEHCTRGMGSDRCMVCSCGESTWNKKEWKAFYLENRMKKKKVEIGRVRATVATQVPYSAEELQDYADGKITVKASGMKSVQLPDVREETETQWFKNGPAVPRPNPLPVSLDPERLLGMNWSSDRADRLREQPYPSSSPSSAPMGKPSSRVPPVDHSATGDSDGEASPSPEEERPVVKRVSSVAHSTVRRTLRFAEGATLTRLHRRDEGRVTPVVGPQVESRSVRLILCHRGKVFVHSSEESGMQIPMSTWPVSEVDSSSAAARALNKSCSASKSLHLKLINQAGAREVVGGWSSEDSACCLTRTAGAAAVMNGRAMVQYLLCQLDDEEARSLRAWDVTSGVLPMFVKFEAMFNTVLGDDERVEHGKIIRSELRKMDAQLDPGLSALRAVRDWCRAGDRDNRLTAENFAATCSAMAYPTRVMPLAASLPDSLSDVALPHLTSWSTPAQKPSSIKGLSDKHAVILTDGRSVFVSDSGLPTEPVVPSDQEGEQVARRALKAALLPWGARESQLDMVEILVTSRFDYTFTRLGTRFHVLLLPSLGSLPGLELSKLGRLDDGENLSTLRRRVDTVALDTLSGILDKEVQLQVDAVRGTTRDASINLIGQHEDDDPGLVGGGGGRLRSKHDKRLRMAETQLWLESEVDDEPPLANSTCAYLKDVVVCQRARNGKSGGKQYRVDAAACRVPGMGDSGAYTSVMTDGLVQTLPPDAVLEWQLSPPKVTTPEEASGVGGAPLVILGHARVAFYIGGKLFKHTFMVIEGSPVFILGNDFLGKCQATIESSTSGGPGSIRLLHRKTNEWVVCELLPDEDEEEVNQVSQSSAKRVSRVAPSGPQATPQKAPYATELDTDFSAAESEVDGNRPEAQASEVPTSESAPADAPRLRNPLERLVVRKHLLYAARPFKVPGRTERILKVRLPKALADSTEELMISPLPERAGLEGSSLRVAYSITRAERGYAFIKVVNPFRRDVYTSELTPLGSVDSDHYVLRERQPDGSQMSAWDALSELEREQLMKAVVDKEAKLTPSMRKAAYDLLARRVGAFAMDPMKPNRTHLLEVEIDLQPGSRPHRHAPSRHGQEGHRITDAAVDEMLANGIIRRGTGAWASRTVLVAKKSGEARFCVDLRDLNSKMVVQDTPLPRCDDSIERLAGAPWDKFSPGKAPTGRQFKMFHTLDLASGFWCLPIKEEHKERTGFVTERGKFEWNFLPFGLCSGPSYMQRVIEATLQGLSYEICMPYLDDVAIWASGATQKDCFDQAMERLDWVLERFEWAGLTAKPKKCNFFAETVEYLGHMIGPDGVSVHPDKCEAVSRIKATDINSLEAVRSFLGLVGYFRKFIPGFPVIAAPLTVLTKAGVDVATESQKDECQEAVEKLKTALASAPVLAAPVPPTAERPFELHTDGASLKGIGACLMQPDEDGTFKPLGYYGRRLIDAETRYTVTEIELLAIVQSIKHYRHMLWGQKFTIVTDHAALRWLETLKDNVGGGLSGRLTRWAVHLMEYRYDVRYKPGKTHYVPDALSRLVSAIRKSKKSRLPKRLALLSRRSQVSAVGKLPSISEAEIAEVYDGDSIESLTTEYEERYGEAMKAMSSDATTADGCLGLASRASSYLVASFMRDRRRKAAAPQAKGDETLPVKLQQTLDGVRSAISASHSGVGLPSREALREMQFADIECAEVMATMITGEPPAAAPARSGEVAPTPRAQNRKRDRLLKTSKDCVFEDGLLCRRVRVDTPEGKLVERLPRAWIPKSVREPYLHAFHDAAGHQSRDRAYSLISRTVYWPGLHADMVDHVQRCHECTFSKRLPRRQGRGHMPEVGEYPFSLCVCDILDMTESRDGYTKVIIFADSLSRWVEAIPLVKDPTSAEVMDIFLRQIVCRYGCPRVVRSDCGSNLTSKLVKEVYDVCGIDLARSTAYHHSSAGVVERFNNTLVEMTKATNEGGKDWADHLPFLCFCYNATPHRVTRESPANILYGRELRLPAEMNLLGPSVPKDWESLREYSKKQVDLLRGAWDAALRSTQMAQAKDAEVTDSRRALDTRFEEGDWVLMHTETPLNKLEWNWSGPYRIEEVLEKDVYRLRDLPNKRIIPEVSVDRLRHYLTVTDALPLEADEFIVDELVDRRDTVDGKEYRVKFRGYNKKANLWLPEGNLVGRCSDLIRDYEAAHPSDAVPPSQPSAPTSRSSRAAHHRAESARRRAESAADASDDSATHGGAEHPPVEQEPLQSAGDPPVLASSGSPSGRRPVSAKYERGVWHYQVRHRRIGGSGGRWLPENSFSSQEREEFSDLRAAHQSSLSAVDKPSSRWSESGVTQTSEVILVESGSGRLYGALTPSETQVDGSMSFIGGHRTWSDESSRATAQRKVVNLLKSSPARALVMQALAKAPAFSAELRSTVALSSTTYFAVCLPREVLSRLTLSADGEEEMYHFGSFSPTAYADSRPAAMWNESINASQSAASTAISWFDQRLEGERLARSPSHEPPGVVSRGP